MKNNVIPRQFGRITAEQLTDTNAGKPGDIWHILKNDFGLCGLNTRTGKYWYIFVSHLRQPEQWRIVEILKRKEILQ